MGSSSPVAAASCRTCSFAPLAAPWRAPAEKNGLIRAPTLELAPHYPNPVLMVRMPIIGYVLARLGRCPDNSSDSWLTVRADGFIAHDTRCSIVQAAADKSSNFLSGEGQTWTRNYWMSLQLLMQETEREP
jgi:hypothetical protein